MTDPSDEELRRAIKISVQRSLKGWEFTPTMARQVLERIAAEEAATDFAPAGKRSARSRVHRGPLAAWTAVAAAAAALAVYGGVNYLRPGSAGVPASETASTAKVQEQQSSTFFDGESAAEAEIPAGAGGPAAVVADTLGTEAGQLQVTSEVAPAVAGEEAEWEEDAGVAEQSEGGTEDWAGDRAVATMVAMASAEGASPHQSRTVHLPALAGAAPAGEQSQETLSLETVQALGEHRIPRSDRGSREAGDLTAVSSSGRTAVVEESRLSILSASGQLEQAITLPCKPVGILWVGPDLLAVADPAQVILLQNGMPLWTIPFAARGMAAPAKAELLLIWDETQAWAVELTTGREVWRAVPDQSGAVVTECILAPDGRYVAMVAAVDDGFALWVLDGSGNLVLAERFASQPEVEFQDNQAVVTQPDGVRVYSLSL